MIVTETTKSSFGIPNLYREIQTLDIIYIKCSVQYAQ